MYAVERLSSYFSRGVYTVSAPFHSFGGAVDIIVVQQQDGSFKSSPWYVKFGKFQGGLKAKEKIVNISVNGAEANFHMYMDHKGEAYFLTEVDGEEGDAAVSPSSGEEIDKKSQSGKLVKAQSLVVDDKKPHSLTQTDRGNRRKLTRTKSRRFRILGLSFGRKSLKEGGGSRKREPIMERVSSLERAEIAADLLELNWSTNLKADHKRKDKNVPGPLTRVLEGGDKDTGQLVEEVGKDTQVNKNKANLGSPFADDILNCCSPGLIHQQKNELMNDGIGEPEDFDKITGLVSVSRAHGQVLDGSTLESFVAPVKHEMPFKQLTRENDEVNVVNELVFEVESRGEISSYVYFETKERSSADSENFDEQSHGTPQSGCNEVELPTEIRISEVNSLPEYGEFTSVEILGGSDNLKSSVTNSIEPEIMEVIHQRMVVQRLFPDKTLETDLKRHLENQSDCQLTKFSSTNLVSNENRLSRVESLTKTDFIVVEEMLHSIKEAEPRAICTLSGLGDLSGLVQEMQKLREVVEIQEHQISPEVTTSPREGNVIASTEKAATQDLISCFSLGGNKFLSSDTDSVVAGGIHYEATNDHPAECMVEAELRLSNLNHPSAFSPCHQSFQSPLSRTLISYPGERNQESFPRENLPEEPSTPATAICIPTSGAHAGEVGQHIMPFPIIPNHIDDLQAFDDKSSLSRPLDLTLPSLSRSLDLAYENSKFEMVAKDLLAYLKLFALENDLTPVQSTSEGVHATDCGQGFQDNELTSTNYPVEISLCRHLLLKGMGAKAASQAFDSEKLNLEKFKSIGLSIAKSEQLVMRFNGHYFHWESAAPTILGMISFDQEHMSEPEGTTVVDQVQRPLDRESVPAGGTWRPWPFKFGKPKSKSFPPNCNSNKVIDGENLVTTCNTSKTKAAKKKIWSNVPTSDQLASLNLKEGQNVITFTFSTAMLGGEQVDARIYLWKWSARVVLSDVDGTITKSDVLGQFMPLVGKDWSQTGVAHLFSAIKENGYQLVFLSARAISQAYLTRQFLANLKQDGKVLPDGPLLISPDGIFPSLYREVIRRAPHEFKIACLKDIRALFPPERNPFYAGFGNRETDEISYLKAGIPRGKIFTINSKGEVAVNRLVNTKSYTSIHSLVNDMFPAKASAEQEVFNSWNYWKLPLPAIKM